MLIADIECRRCNGSGEIARSIYYPCGYVCAGPVPEHARNVAASKCDRCDGTGVVEYNLEEDAEW